MTSSIVRLVFAGFVAPWTIAAELPSELAPAFTPPAEFANKLGNYRSVLRFKNGAPVKTPDDWSRRRREIINEWHDVMGPWPPMIEKPRMERLGSTQRDGFTQHRVSIEIAEARLVPGELLVPPGAPPFPAVLVPFYDPETSIGLGKPQRDFAYQLTRRGFVTLSIGSPGGDARKPDITPLHCQPLSALAYFAGNCANALANLAEVDPARIGIVGHSYGGKWAMFGACLNQRFACGAWSDPGIIFNEKRPSVNYWDPWYLGATGGPPRPPGLPDPEHPRAGAYKVMHERGMDLHELQTLMAPRPFLVSGGSEDPPANWIALNHSIAVNRLLGFEQRVAMTNRPAHEPTPESNEVIYRFFEHFLGR
ncbi:MAG TPA: sialidase [Chthoniobacteraceae bacterium]|nr:sialidase [Chthoniobacteraceae bacterium]